MVRSPSQECHSRYPPLNPQDQLSTGTYDLLSNLALLKLYQFNPALLSPSSTLSILFLSLTHAPFSPDFSLCWSLLSDSFVTGSVLPPLPLTAEEEEDLDEEEQAARMRVPAPAHGERETAERLDGMSKLLQARRFKAFWALLRLGGEGGDKEEEVRALVGGLREEAMRHEEALRDKIVKEVADSFKAVERKTLESFLGFEGQFWWPTSHCSSRWVATRTRS